MSSTKVAAGIMVLLLSVMLVTVTAHNSLTRAAAAGPGPAVTGIAPNTGSPAGGTSVTITGTSFTGATAVHFGSTAATFAVTSATQIAVTSPPGAGNGGVNVTVSTPNGTSATLKADLFTYGPLDHIFTIVMENEGSTNIIGDTTDAHLGSLP